MMQERVTRDFFFDNHPKMLEGIEIVAVGRFEGGSREGGRYAAAAALTRRGESWCTHTLIYNDDQKSWFLHQGNYDFKDRAAAESDMAIRHLG